MQAEQFEDVPMNVLVRVLERFLLLDRRLSSALQRMAHGELGRQITLAAEAELRGGRSTKGIVILRLICHYYKTNKTEDLVYEITGLYKVSMRVTMRRDSRTHGFKYFGACGSRRNPRYWRSCTSNV